MLLTVASPVAAQAGVEPLLPPADFEGTYNETTQEVHLSWQAPTENTSYAYTVYRNGQMLNTTQATNYTDTLPLASVVAYHVTATPVEGNDAGQESAPTSPYLFMQSSAIGPLPAFEVQEDMLRYNSASDIPGRDCTLIAIWLTDDPPFVSFTIYARCIPIIGPAVELNDGKNVEW